MSWTDYYKCDAGHIGLRPMIVFIMGDKLYRACSQECRNAIERQAQTSAGRDPLRTPPEEMLHSK